MDARENEEENGWQDGAATEKKEGAKAEDDTVAAENKKDR